jgi:hypothetical protein
LVCLAFSFSGELVCQVMKTQATMLLRTSGFCELRLSHLWVVVDRPHLPLDTGLCWRVSGGRRARLTTRANSKILKFVADGRIAHSLEPIENRVRAGQATSGKHLNASARCANDMVVVVPVRSRDRVANGAVCKVCGLQKSNRVESLKCAIHRHLVEPTRLVHRVGQLVCCERAMREGLSQEPHEPEARLCESESSFLQAGEHPVLEGQA